LSERIKPHSVKLSLEISFDALLELASKLLVAKLELMVTKARLFLQKQSIYRMQNMHSKFAQKRAELYGFSDEIFSLSG
jgi:hypothetical protein